ncbi:hypothetical protein Bpfe_006190 [Biomphalaria pfeifferi]|uniref:Uncharacterized protein n=1 Tax=Biomphalaria pfeifferi TaxID=112525 RepID=A0AAD8C159_BIOPF|nr:hypothetical protein Bpfe_006190 [Biomphalaria pfeifferi]
MLFHIITGIKMSSNVDTRAANKCPVFGHSCELVTNVLPTYMDMMKYYSHIRQKLSSDQAKEPTPYDRKLKEDSRAKKALILDLIDQCPGVIDLNNDDSSDAEIGLDEDLSQTEAESNTMITDTETPTSSKPSSSHLRRKLPKLAKICDRFAVSDRVGAAVGTAVLEDFGIVSQTEAANVIDRYKLRRE